MVEDIRWFFGKIEKCKQIIGEERIYSNLKKLDLSRQSILLKLSRRDPLLFNIHLADKQIYESSPHLPLSDQIIKIGTLGHYLNILEKNKVIGLNTKINALFTDKFEKVMYEIQVAAIISKRGYNVEFVKENQNKKTPDLLIHFDDCDLEVECKKKEDLTGRDKQNETFWNRVTKEANNIMNQNKKNLVVILIMERDPKNGDFEPIIRDIKESIEKIHDELIIVKKQFYKLSLKQTDPFDKVVISPKINLDNVPQSVSSAINEGNYYRDCGILNPNIELDCESFHCEGIDSENGLMQQKNRRFFGFTSKIMPDRISSIIDSIHKASKQLSGNNAGVIFIDQNIFNRNNMETDFTRLGPLIKGVLKNNPKISGIVITQILHIRNSQGYRYIHSSKIFPNEKSKFPMPNQIWEICHIER